MNMINQQLIGFSARQFYWIRRKVLPFLTVILFLGVEARAYDHGETVQANGLVWVRDNAGGKYIGEQKSGTLGVILAGPVQKQIAGAGKVYNWYRIDWPSNPDGWVADIGLIVPPPPHALHATHGQQRRLDTSAAIPFRGTLPETAGVELSATVTDSNPAHTIRIEVELRRLPAFFNGVPNFVGSYVASGSIATVPIFGLSPGEYGWRYRAVDDIGQTTNWVLENHPDFTITGCDALIAPLNTDLSALGGDGSFTIGISPSCQWTAETSNPWIHTSSSGAGSGSVSFSVDLNDTGVPRTGSITVAGQTFTISQDAACNYTLSTSEVTHTSAKAGGGIRIAAPKNCVWTASSGDPWITTDSSGHGDGWINYSIEKNDSPEPREGTITVEDQFFTISQAGSSEIPPFFTSEPLDQHVIEDGSATFIGAATGDPSPSIHWEISTDDGETWNPLIDDESLSGSTTDTLIIENATLIMNGNQFRAVASNGITPDAVSTSVTLFVDRIVENHVRCDFNSDALPDLFFRSRTSGELQVWTIENGQHIDTLGFGTATVGYDIVGLGDFNSDGESDILGSITRLRVTCGSGRSIRRPSADISAS